MTGFILLHTPDLAPIYFNPAQIALYRTASGGAHTEVRMVDGSTWNVAETLEEIAAIKPVKAKR